MSTICTSENWLERHLSEVPPRLAGAIRDLVAPGIAGGGSGMIEAALHGFESVVNNIEDRDSAIVLLAADALLTYAFEAAADPALGGSATVAVELAGRIGPCGSLGALLGASS
jgi:hypothetical protein